MVEIVLLKTDSRNRSQFDADDDEPLGVVADALSSSVTVVDEFVQQRFEEEPALTILADTAPELNGDSTGLFHPSILSASVLGAQGFCDDNSEEDALPITVVASQQFSNQVSLHPCTASLAKPLLSRCQGSSSIESGFRVLFLAMGALQKMIPYDDLKRSQLLNHGTYSTHFSGIGSVEVACDMLSAVVKAFTAACHALCNVCLHVRSPNTARRFWAVVCPAAFFSDILDYCPCLPSWQQLRRFTPKDRFKTVMRCFQKKQSNNCVCHSCKCRPEPASFDFSGSPCQPWSAFGKKGGLDDARSLLVFVWMAVVRSSLPAVAIHECTPEFLTWLLDEFLGPFYLIVHIKASPADFGWGFIRRARVFSICIRRRGVQLLGQIESVYRKVCQTISAEICRMDLNSVCVATTQQCLEEEKQSEKPAWAATFARVLF